MSEQWQVQIPMGPHVYDPADVLSFRVSNDYFYLYAKVVGFRPWYRSSWYTLYLSLLVKAVRAVATSKIKEHEGLTQIAKDLGKAAADAINNSD